MTVIENIKINMIRLLGIGVIFLTAYLVIHSFNNKDCCMCGTIENNCCPCPNDKWFHKVEEWSGQDASSAGSWLYMCDEYQEANNITFDCFE